MWAPYLSTSSLPLPITKAPTSHIQASVLTLLAHMLSLPGVQAAGWKGRLKLELDWRLLLFLVEPPAPPPPPPPFTPPPTDPGKGKEKPKAKPDPKAKDAKVAEVRKGGGWRVLGR